MTREPCPFIGAAIAFAGFIVLGWLCSAAIG
jgi:hypothetical protein